MDIDAAGGRFGASLSAPIGLKLVQPIRMVIN